MRQLLLTMAAGVALGSAVSLWLAGLLALHFGVDGHRYELVCTGDACFLLDHKSGEVQQTAATGYAVVVAGERAYRINRSTGEIDFLAESGLVRLGEQTHLDHQSGLERKSASLEAGAR